MSNSLTEQPEVHSVIIGYDPTHQTVAEVASIDETLVALMPWGEQHTGLKANEILKTAVQSDRIQLRQIDE